MQSFRTLVGPCFLLIGNMVNQTLHTQMAMRPDGIYDIRSLTIEALLAEQDWAYWS